MEDSALRQRLIDAGQARAKHFHWDRCARASLACLRSIAV
jgi:hypothetical protein